MAQRPAWAMTGAELLRELDGLHAVLSRLQTRRLDLLARLDDLGHARELGARDTTELIAIRHRLDPAVVRRDLKHATALHRYPVVAANMPDPSDPLHPADPAADADPSETADATEGPDQATQPAVVLNPAQARAIVEALDRVPATVPADDLRVAETELVAAARILGPRELRRLGQAALARLDTDGPNPTRSGPRRGRTCGWRRPGSGPRPGSGSAGSWPTPTPSCSGPWSTPRPSRGRPRPGSSTPGPWGSGARTRSPRSCTPPRRPAAGSPRTAGYGRTSR